MVFTPLTIGSIGAAILHLASGEHCLVSIGDWEDLNDLSWRTNTNGYAYHKNNDNSQIRMHRYILTAPDNYDVDHINGNRLDNRRCNLRLASRHQNNGNQRRLRSNKQIGRFKGVRWHKQLRRWTAYIVSGGKQRHIGCFDREIDAARAYDRAAVQQWGDFAATNESLGRFTGGEETPQVEQ